MHLGLLLSMVMIGIPDSRAKVKHLRERTKVNDSIGEHGQNDNQIISLTEIYAFD